MNATIQQAIAAHNQGKHKEAEQLYREILKVDSNHLDANNNLGALLYGLDRLEEAEKSYRKAIELKSDFAEGHYNLAITLQKLNRLEEAEKSYKKVIELKPNYTDAYNYLGNVQKTLGEFDEAEKSYRKAIELKPDYAEAHKNLGIILQKLDKLDEAKLSLKRTVELKPDYAEAHYNLAITLQKLGKLDEAELSFRKSINSFEKVIKINPKNHKAYSNISNIYLKIKEFEKSYNYYLKFLQLESKEVVSKAKLENIIPKFAKKILSQDRIPTFFDNAVENQLTQQNNSSYDYCELFDKVQISKENRFILYSERKKNNPNTSFKSRLFDGLPFIASQGLHSPIKWKENPLYKSAYDLIIYSMILQEVKPDIIIELGSGLGGSAIWLADTAAALGLDTHIYSYDINKPKAKHHKVTFIEYDLLKIKKQIKPPCWELFRGKKIIIEDAHVNLKNILYLFDIVLKKDDYLIIEDSSQKQDIISNFSHVKEPKYKLDQFYIDFFGANVTSCINSIFKSQ